MGAKISTCYFSHNFGPNSTKLYDKYVSHGKHVSFKKCGTLKFNLGVNIVQYFENG